MIRRRTIAAIACAVLALGWLASPVLPEDADSVSSVLQARDGTVLHMASVDDGRIRLPVDLAAVDPAFIAALIAIEDRRFHRHVGVDVLAIGRALRSNLSAGEIVSGASTITQQLGRQYRPRPRTVPTKMIEALEAVRLDLRMGKREQLERYLTRISYGSNIEGIEAASRIWLGKSARYLTVDEIALLLALPQSPEARRPDRNPVAAKAGRDRIIDRMLDADLIDPDMATAAKLQPVPTARQALPDRDILAHQTFGDGISTLDPDEQARATRLLAAWTTRQAVPVNAAALIVHAPSREVRALVGTGARHHAGGWIDMTDRVRSPGSTLKPFIYAMARDDGTLDLQSDVRDAPTRFGSYRPENFTRRYHGQVTIREALQHSLNVPAVMALHAVGADRFRAAMSAAGPQARGRIGDAQGDGLALALGGTGLSARDLVVLYTALANGGEAGPLRWTPDAPEGDRYRLVSEATAAAIVDALRDAPVPKGFANMQGVGRVAYKTGTSYGFRDSWAAGLAGDYVIIVWTGRPDGAPRPGQTGRASAAPLLFDLAAPFLDDDSSQRVTEAPEALSTLPSETDRGPVILFPADGTDVLASDRGLSIAVDSDEPVTLFVSGQAVRKEAGLAVWTPRNAGFYKISAVDRLGRSANANIRVVTRDQIVDAPPQFR
ncbi:penicillin-binding protein 1C [Algimonas porphyrae]|uniref:peptidoglycan glycosyltransferase n=1 Tax=Algimonas porphyrae TaxID=1128113 RepID=A0ABQ5V0Q0_9PROT|nr:penicillin-binding protein 1C [Algimonas porphyrae]GLQ20210.1 penicillin-binding protein 1C [Algimonas porphyrae]